MTTVIAERKLLFAIKGQTPRKSFVIRIHAPRPVEPGSVSWKPDGETASCVVEFVGIPGVTPTETYGADSIQALRLASDIEPTLKRLSMHYDFYFPTGEGYFDE